MSASAVILPEKLIQLFLRSIKSQFYRDRETLYFQERDLLMGAICHPARYLDELGVRISAKRYQEILTTVIRTINKHGNVAEMRSPGRYLGKAVEEHMRHHGEEYYEIGKRSRDAIADTLADILSGVRVGDKAIDETVPVLAATHRAIAAAKPPRRKTAPRSAQGDLFSKMKRTNTSC